MGRVLGLDFGTKRVGLAISDPRRSIATPLEVYDRRDRDRDSKYFRRIVGEHEVDQIVVGLPLHTGGNEGVSSRLARGWGRWLGEVTGLPVAFFDERYTTVEAEESMIAAGLKRHKRVGLRDMLAARLLLQNYLDAGCPVEEAPATPLADPATDGSQVSPAPDARPHGDVGPEPS